MSDELHELLGAYAIGALSDEDAARFEAYLETSPEAQEELFRLSDAVLALADVDVDAGAEPVTAEVPTPPPVPEAEPQATVHDLDERRNRRASRLLAAAAVVAGLVFGFWASGLFDENRVETIASADDVETIVLTGDGGSVEVVLSNSEAGVALDDENLGALEEPELYVLWVIRHDGDAPEFVGNITEFADVDKAWDIPVENVDVLAISIEQAPSPTTPSDEIVFVGERTR